MKKRYLGRNIVGIIMGALALAWLVPIYYLVINSFKPLLPIMQDISSFPTSFYTDNFKHIWKMSKFALLFGNSLFITVLSLIGIILTCSMAGYYLARLRNTKVENMAIFYLLSGFIIPFQGVMIPLVKMMGDLNLTDSRLGLVILYIALEAPLGVYLYYGATKSIPISLEESARIDGAGPFRTFFSIIFPLLGPITTTLTILASLWIWNDFLIPLILITDPVKRTIPLGTAALFFSQFSSRWNFGITAILMASIPMMVMYLMLQKYIVKGITEGTEKG